VAYQSDAVFTGEDAFTYTMSAGGTPATGTVTVVCAAGPVPLTARASAAPGPGLTVRFAGMVVGGGGAGTDVYEDDFSTNSTARYTWEATGSHTWDADNQWIRIVTGDNISQTVSLDLELPDTGYARIDMIKRADYPTDNSQSLRLEQDATNAYVFSWCGSGYASQGVKKVLDGVVVEELLQTGTVNAEDVPIFMEMWWSSTRLMLGINGSVRRDLTTTNTTALAPSRFKFNNNQIDPDWCAIRIRDGWGYRYAWDFGDGTRSTEASPQHTYAAEGTYEAVFTVTDWINAATDTVTVVVTVASDTDGDGLPDNVDPDDDNDGISDADEAIAGTDPLDAGSVLCLGPCIVNPSAPGEFVVTWSSVSNRTYTLYAATNLVQGFGIVLHTNLPATPPVNVYTDSVDTVGCRFYRVSVGD